MDMEVIVEKNAQWALEEIITGDAGLTTEILLNCYAQGYSSNLNYQLQEMFNEQVVAKEVLLDLGYGNEHSVQICLVEVDRQEVVVKYHASLPEYTDEDWVCSGTIELFLISPESREQVIDAVLQETRRMVEQETTLTILDSIRNGTDRPGAAARILNDVMEGLLKDASYVYDKNAAGADGGDIRQIGNIETARQIVEVGGKIGKLIDRAWAGAYLAKMLHEHPLVESFRLHCYTEQEYDDNNYFTDRKVYIGELAFVNGVPEVVLEDSDGVTVDASGYTDILEEKIRDGSDEWDLYAGFCSFDADDNFYVTVSRSDLKALLENDVIDGLAAGDIIAKTVLEG